MYDINENISNDFIRHLGDKNRTTLVYHHYDNDGHGPVVLLNVLRSFEIFNRPYFKCCSKTADVIIQDIESGFIDRFTDIFIVDLSVTSIEIAEKINELSKTKNILLFDHHKSALWLNEYPFAHVVAHDVENGIIECGTSLFYKFLKPLFESKRFLLTRAEALRSYVELVADYDTFNWKNTRCKNSPEAYELNMIFKSKPHKLFIQDMVRNINSGYIFSKEDNQILSYINYNIIKQRLVFENNATFINTKILDRNYNVAYGYCDNYTSEVGDYINSNYPNVDITIMINMAQGTVSMRTAKNNIDLSEIAVKLNGGGHPKAAGFSLSSIKSSETFKDDFMRILNDFPNGKYHKETCLPTDSLDECKVSLLKTKEEV